MNGHGHVIPNADGSKARCGGPGICGQCSLEAYKVSKLDPTRIQMDTDPVNRRLKGVAVHGNTPFDVPFISQIEGNLWQGGCEGGMILPDFFDHLISLYPWELYTVEHSISTMLSVRMYDSSNQLFGQVDDIARWVVSRVKEGPTLVHCQAGLNRSSLVAGRALTMMGYTGPQAIKLLRDQRSPACLCNKSFEEWLRAKRASGERMS